MLKFNISSDHVPREGVNYYAISDEDRKLWNQHTYSRSLFLVDERDCVILCLSDLSNVPVLDSDGVEWFVAGKIAARPLTTDWEAFLVGTIEGVVA